MYHKKTNANVGKNIQSSHGEPMGIQELIMDQIKPRLEKLAKKQMPGLCLLENWFIPMDRWCAFSGIL